MFHQEITMTQLRHAAQFVVALAILAAPFALAAAQDEKPKVYLGVKIAKEEGGQEIVVNDVLPDSPAAKAGLKKGDVILKMEKKEYKDPMELVKVLVTKKPGDKITLGIKRDGKEMDVEVTLAEAPKQ
jgi:S1-C subfamily serine protease